jgi:hypothetical protein
MDKGHVSLCLLRVSCYEESIFDKLQHTAECDADIAASKRKYQGFKSIKNFTRQIGYGIIKP